MSLFGCLEISASALTAQQLRMDVLSQNMANVDTTRTAEGTPYKRKAAIFQERSGRPAFYNALTQAQSKIRPNAAGNGVKVSSIETDLSEGTKVYDPAHPDADEEGYVEKPNVNVVAEMVNLISASRSYEANVTAINITKGMIAKTFEINKV